MLQLTDTGTKPKPIQDVTPFCNKIRPCCFSLFVIRILIVQQNQESIYCERCFQVFILYVCPTNDHRLRCQKWLYCPLIKNNQSITISILLQPLHGYVATQVLALYQGRRNTTKLLAHQTNKPQDHQATRPYVRPFNKPSRWSALELSQVVTPRYNTQTGGGQISTYRQDSIDPIDLPKYTIVKNL